MPTDEQLRERFEEVRGKGYPDHANVYLFQRDEFDNYVLSDMNSQWHGWRMAYRSRDAEVQALREALESVHYRATRWEVLPTVEAHQSVLKDIGEDARAALAGEDDE